MAEEKRSNGDWWQTTAITLMGVLLTLCGAYLVREDQTISADEIDRRITQAIRMIRTRRISN